MYSLLAQTEIKQDELFMNKLFNGQKYTESEKMSLKTYIVFVNLNSHISLTTIMSWHSPCKFGQKVRWPPITIFPLNTWTCILTCIMYQFGTKTDKACPGYYILSKNKVAAIWPSLIRLWNKLSWMCILTCITVVK